MTSPEHRSEGCDVDNVLYDEADGEEAFEPQDTERLIPPDFPPQARGAPTLQRCHGRMQQPRHRRSQPAPATEKPIPERVHHHQLLHRLPSRPRRGSPGGMVTRSPRRLHRHRRLRYRPRRLQSCCRRPGRRIVRVPLTKSEADNNFTNAAPPKPSSIPPLLSSTFPFPMYIYAIRSFRLTPLVNIFFSPLYIYFPILPKRLIRPCTHTILCLPVPSKLLFPRSARPSDEIPPPLTITFGKLSRWGALPTTVLRRGEDPPPRRT